MGKQLEIGVPGLSWSQIAEVGGQRSRLNGSGGHLTVGDGLRLPANDGEWVQQTFLVVRDLGLGRCQRHVLRSASPHVLDQQAEDRGLVGIDRLLQEVIELELRLGIDGDGGREDRNRDRSTGRVGVSQRAADAVLRLCGRRCGVIGNEREIHGADVVARDVGQGAYAVDDTEQPTVIGAGYREHAVGRVAVGVGDVDSHADIGQTAGGLGVRQREGAGKCWMRDVQRLADLQLDSRADPLPSQVFLGLGQIGLGLCADVRMSEGLACLLSIFRRGECGLEGQHVEEVGAPTARHLRRGVDALTPILHRLVPERDERLGVAARDGAGQRGGQQLRLLGGRDRATARPLDVGEKVRHPLLEGGRLGRIEPVSVATEECILGGRDRGEFAVILLQHRDVTSDAQGAALCTGRGKDPVQVLFHLVERRDRRNHLGVQGGSIGVVPIPIEQPQVAQGRR